MFFWTACYHDEVDVAERVAPVLVVALCGLELLEGDLHVVAIALVYVPNDLIPLVPLLLSQDVFFS